MANRLIDSTSPYLLQHAQNPVDWYPWGAEAIERARREGKPIFLSIGYAACHWCHVMEHLVFEVPAIAAVMNEHFINIKVDREERPDLDELYMLATQLMTGQGGWPMSVWLTPALEPFYAGTYFPPEDGYGRPGFPRLLKALADSWKNRRAELLEQSKQVVEAMRLHADETDRSIAGEITAEGKVPLAGWLRLAVEQSADRFDEVHGGFGGAPKFPPHQHLQLWLALLGNERSGLSVAEQENVAGKVTKTLDWMMNGGIYDHVGGGFARYSTDAEWLVPHFEKMLYDSAQLAPVYAAASVMFKRGDYARVARGTLDFFMREMLSGDGAFYSSLDADSEGAEGKYYVWTMEDITAALPEEGEAALVIRHFNITAEGNWNESPVPHGTVLAAVTSSESAALEGALLKMRAYREKRERPRLDDKILTAWNGLMLSALAIAGRVLGEKKYVEAGRRLAEFLLRHHVDGAGNLLRVSRGGPAHTAGFLDDYAFLFNGLMDLMEADPSGAEAFKARTVALADAMVRDFQDVGHGGFYFTGPRHEELFARMKNAADNATPSANGVAMRALGRLAPVTGNEAYRETAMRVVAAFRTNIARRPEYFPTLLLGLLENADASHDEASETAGVGAANGGKILSLALEGIEPAEGPTGMPAFEFAFRLTIANGYHIQPAEGAAGFTATKANLRVTSGNGKIREQRWTFPQIKSGSPAHYAGSISLKATVTFADLERGAIALRATVMGQPCSENACLEPETTSLDVPLECQA